MESISIQKILDLDEDGATCTILEFKTFKIMFDCGINNQLDISKYEQAKDLVLDVDIILITSAGLEFSGALPYFINKYNFKVSQFNKAK
jgi:Cft2 family RNA processing exonuclease